ncbi:MAG: hypothetical protein EOP55_09965 [Sphingobacteriales bacterium]|nr:MAG: hypothetical protein EOP55_09965 [Sphingobacteriales bacterium]
MISNILSGWKNYLDNTEIVESVAVERAGICANCPHAKQGRMLAFIKDTIKEIEGTYCNKCGCPLSPKVRSNDTCPTGKW